MFNHMVGTVAVPHPYIYIVVYLCIVSHNAFSFYRYPVICSACNGHYAAPRKLRLY